MKRYIKASGEGSKDNDFSEADFNLPVTYEYKINCPYIIVYYDKKDTYKYEIPDYDYEVFDEVEELVDYINTDIFDNEFDEVMKENLNYAIHKDYSEKCNVFDIKQHLEFKNSITDIDIYWIIDITSDVYPEDELGEIINDICQTQLADGWGEDMSFSEDFFEPIKMKYDEDDTDIIIYEAPVSLEWQWLATKAQFVAKL